MPANHISYRADIDGLRAVAVLAVIGFHAAPAYVPGGFVGVDIFFVISGFLITRLLLADARRGALTLSGFWARRVRRIFPALVTLLVAVLAAGWYLLLTHEFAAVGRHVTASALFVQNVALWRETGYFDTAAESKPLLHLWSLAVEEQFYLLWPLLFAWGHARSRRVLAWLCVALLLASFATSVVQSARGSAAAFFLLPSRWWELMAGCLLAQWLPGTAAAPGASARVAPDGKRELAAWFGMAAIALSFFVVDSRRPFPGPWALLPVAGTLALLWAGPGTRLARTVLSQRVVVFIGLVSYPLYLWHWPLLSFPRILGGPLDARETAAAIAVAFALAVGTYYFIERPLRHSRRRVAVGGLVLAMTVVAAIGAAGFAGWWKSRLAGTPADRFDAAAHDWRFPGPGFRREVTSQGLPVWRAGRGERTVLVYGDSNAQQYGPRVESLLEARRLRDTSVVFATTGSCPPLPGVTVAGRNDCAAFAGKADALARSPAVDAVIVAAQWVGYLDNPAFTLPRDGVPMSIRAGDPALNAAIEQLGEQIRAWRALGKEVVVVLNIPVGTELDPRNILRRTWSGATTVDAPPLDRRKWAAGTSAYLDRIAQVARVVGATVVDPVVALCNDNDCPALAADGQPIYRDIAHLRASFVRDRVTYLDDALIGRVR